MKKTGFVSRKKSEKAKCFCRLLFVIYLLFYSAGCGNKFFDPTQVGRFRTVPAVNVILDSLGVAEEKPSVWEAAEDPRPIDVMVFETDHVFAPGDAVRISIFELFQEGAIYLNDYVVTETGKVSIPQVGIIEAEGLTESQLEEEIRGILSPAVLKEPSVTVSLLNSQKRTFSISGNGVPKPGRYGIPRYDYRLLDAMADGAVATQYNVSYVYVLRSITGKEIITEADKSQITEPKKIEQPVISEQEMLEIIAPHAQRQRIPQQQELIIASAEMITDEELTEVALPEGFESLADEQWENDQKQDSSGTSEQLTGRETIDKPIETEKAGRIEWIFEDGKWIPVRAGPQPDAKPETKIKPEKIAGKLREKLPENFDFDQLTTPQLQTRVIKIPADKLAGGDPRYNVVIRPGDSIQVPVDIIGEFCIMGNVNAQGFIPLTGRKMTLKMAIAAAGGFGPLAWPKNCEVVRRLGKDREEIVMVDLDKIASGEQPDFFIKPDDLINVGTHPTARWRAVLRNAFRATYGFGFIYDRNFADRDYGTRRPIPDLF